jgi:D-tyrosyl-tRNA(Tyr) deacylase
MKAVLQRVKKASVSVEGRVTGAVDWGLLVYVGVARGDSRADADWLAAKIAGLRVFDDAQGKMNLSLSERAAQGAGEGRPGVLLVSQVTLLADARKGRRPYYGEAADPADAKPLYEYVCRKIREHGLVCETGVFQASREVTYTNDGPVTILLDTRETGTGGRE